MSSDEEEKVVDAMDKDALKAELKKLKKRLRKPQVTVRTEKKIPKKLDGENPSKYSDWRYTAEAALQGRQDEEQREMLLAALEGKALREVLRHAEKSRDTGKKILEILDRKYCDRRTSAQIRREFYVQAQENKTINEYTDVLIECLEGAEKTLGIDNEGLEKMLIEQFCDNVRDSQLKWQLSQAKKTQINGKDLSFDELRNIALEFEAGQGPKKTKLSRMDQQTAVPASELTQLTQAVQKLSGTVEQLNRRVENMEGRLENQNFQAGKGRGGGGWQPRGRGGYYFPRRGNYNGQNQQQQDQQQQQAGINNVMNANAREFVPNQKSPLNQGN